MLVGNWVFTVTNGLLLLSAIVGWYITARFKRSAPQPAAEPTQNAATEDARLHNTARSALAGPG
jgi:hypothetical protein